jgi:gas vesicle protein
MARNSNSSAFVLGLLLGTAGGVVTALFTAPCSGEETIDQLRRRANRLLGRAEDIGPEAYDWATAPMPQAAPDLSAEVEELADLAQDIPTSAAAPASPSAAGAAGAEPLPDNLEQVLDALKSTPVGQEVADDLAEIAEDTTRDSSHPSAGPYPSS